LSEENGCGSRGGEKFLQREREIERGREIFLGESWKRRVADYF
jgi:hypothetical protein